MPLPTNLQERNARPPLALLFFLSLLLPTGLNAIPKCHLLYGSLLEQRKNLDAVAGPRQRATIVKYLQQLQPGIFGAPNAAWTVENQRLFVEGNDEQRCYLVFNQTLKNGRSGAKHLSLHSDLAKVSFTVKNVEVKKEIYGFAEYQGASATAFLRSAFENPGLIVTMGEPKKAREGNVFFGQSVTRAKMKTVKSAILAEERRLAALTEAELTEEDRKDLILHRYLHQVLDSRW